MSEIRIYVADLAAYNNGKLHGVWIDATQDLEDIREQVQIMLTASPEGFAEEYAIHDYEGFGGYSLSEYEGLDSAHNVALFIDEHGELGAELLDISCDLDEAKKHIEENYAGCYDSAADFAQQLTEETSEIPKHLEFYIDYKAMVYDMEVGGDIFIVDMGIEQIHIFWNH